ncbi:hypothetical protein BH09MYX1_BH09MYX1_52910 [soil metagenome]
MQKATTTSPKTSGYALLVSAVMLGGAVLAFWVGIHAGRALDRHGPAVTVAPTAPPTEQPEQVANAK